MKILISIVIVVLASLFVTACARKQKPDLTAGGIYSIHRGGGDFGVVKVLVLDDDAIHIRLYKNKFEQRPGTVDTNELSLGSIEDGEDDFGIGHLPIRTVEFLSWQPELILTTDLTEEELSGYKMWKEASGGIFGQ